MIGLDIETTALTPEEGRLSLVQVATPDGTLVFDVFKIDPAKVFTKAAGYHTVAHNANFEELWLREHYGVELPAALEDTMVMSQVLYGGTEDFKKSGADLQETNLSKAVLSGARLGPPPREEDGEPNPTPADQSGADLSGANLSDAQGITNEELEQQSSSLKGAIMPNGQKYEDWLKSKGRAEDGEN